MFAVVVPTVMIGARHDVPRIVGVALRAGPVAAADLRRHGRLYRRRMAAARRSPASPASTSPARASAASRAASSPASLADLDRLARRLPDARRDDARRRASSVALLLPREKRFVRSEGLGASARQMLRHLRNPQLLATYAVGFGVLFNFIADLHLCELPSRGAALQLLRDAARRDLRHLSGRHRDVRPLTGRVIARFGRRHFVLRVIAVWIVGALLLLAPPLAAHHRRADAVRDLRHAVPGGRRPATSR